jgi:hypothetical protein
VRKRLKEPYCVGCGQEYDNEEAAKQCDCRLNNLFRYGTPYGPMTENTIAYEEPTGNYTDEQILSVIEETIETHPTLRHKSFLIKWLKGFSTIKSPQAQERLKASRKYLPDS